MGIRQKNVHRIRGRDGVVRKYHRHTRAPLPGDVPEDHPVFLAALLAEERQAGRHIRARARPGSLADLVERFMRDSAEYRGYADNTRRWMRPHLGAIAELGGEVRAATIRASHIRQNVNALSPATGNLRRKAWSALMRWARDQGEIAANPVQDVRRLKERRSAGFPAWTRAEIAATRDRHAIGTPERLHFELVYWTGARMSDARTLGPANLRDGFICYDQVKTGNPARAPFTMNLPTFARCFARDLEHLHACIALRPQGQGTWCMTQAGKARSVKGFGNFMSGIAPAGKSGHGLRKARLQLMAESGATTVQMQAWCGHVSTDELETYLRDAAKVLALRGTV